MVVPNDATLQQFDLLRNKVKQGKQRGSNTNTHLNELSRKLQQTLTSKYKELSTIINNWTSEQKKLRHSTPTSSDYPTHIRNAAHKLSILCKVLKHEWNIDL